MTEESVSGNVDTGESSVPDFASMEDTALDDFLSGEPPVNLASSDEEPEETESPEEETENTEEQEEASKEQELTPEQYQEQIAALQTRLQQQEQFIARRGTEIGNLRKQLAAERTAIQQRAEEGDLDPRQAVKDELRLGEIAQEESNAVREHAEMVRIHQAQALMAKHFKPGEISIDDMVTALRNDGVPEEYLAKFSEDPYRHADGTSLLQIAKRAKVEKSFMKLFTVAKQLASENEKLRKGKTDVLKKVDEAITKAPPMTAAKSASRVTSSNTDFASMSDEQLTAFLQKGK